MSGPEVSAVGSALLLRSIAVSGQVHICVIMLCFHFLRCKCPQPALHTAMTLGARYTASEAKSAGFIHQVSSKFNEELREDAITAARRLSGNGLDRSTLTAIKHDLYKDVYMLLNDPCMYLSNLCL